MRGLAVFTLISNMLILIGAGHGAGPIVIFEAMLPRLTSGGQHLTFSLFANYDDSLLATAIFSLIGQLILLFGILTKKIKPTIFALPILWFGLYYITHTVFNDLDGDVARFTLAFAAPFLILSIILFLFLFKDLRKYRLTEY